MEIYRRDQAKVLFSVWPEQAEWFVIGGPATGNEAQTVVAKYPNVKCIGFEPNTELREIQQTEIKFPGVVHPNALWHTEQEMGLHIPKHNHLSGSLCRDLSDCDTEIYTVQTKTLDQMSEKFGPFTNCVLWIDVEHAELAVLQGAKELLGRGDILMVNAEIFKPHLLPPIADLLGSYSLVEVKRWNTGMFVGMCEIIFKKVE